MKNISKGGFTGIDHLGRKISPFLPQPKNEKQVGIFFFIWLGQRSINAYGKAVYDSSEIMKLPDWKNVLFYESDERSPAGEPHYWGKPLFGYYNSEDEWVLRKQLEMLGLAGVDFIAFDTTNALIFPEVYPLVLSNIERMRADGFPAPQAVFYTHARSMDTVRKLYDELYKPGLYPDSWYRVDGKPMIVAYTDPADEAKEAENEGNPIPEPFSQEILDFSHFRHPVWPSNTGSRDDDFSWIEWTYPQPLRGDMMNVSVGAHSCPPFSAAYTRGQLNFGRGYNPDTKENVFEDCEKGTFFQREWDHALKTDPQTIFITGWNEWIAGKLPWDGEYMLCDQASFEYSRDAEPMDGGYRDAFYLQIVRNISAFKHLDLPESTRGTCVYEKPAREIARDCQGGADGVYYKEPAPRNALRRVYMSDDGVNLQLIVECHADVVPYAGKEDSGWMNIFVGKNEPSVDGYSGYTYRIQAAAQGKLAVFHTVDGKKWQMTGTGTYMIKENCVDMQIPFEALEMTDSDESIYFKVWDFVESGGVWPEIDQSYLKGSALPMGRLSCYYKLGEK